MEMAWAGKPFRKVQDEGRRRKARVELNVYYYHRIIARCHYLFCSQKKYYIFKPPPSHPFLVFCSPRPFLCHFLVPSFTLFFLRRCSRGEHCSPLPFIVILEASLAWNLTKPCTLKNGILVLPGNVELQSWHVVTVSLEECHVTVFLF